MIPKDKWTWYGNPLHFCLADSCKFHKGTMIGNYVVSSVGELVDQHGDGYRPVGGNEDDLYETMVFECDGEREECFCPQITGNELYTRRYSSHSEANKGHDEICLMVANGEIGEVD